MLQAEGLGVSKGSPSPWVCHGWGSTGCPDSSLSAWMRAEASGFSPCVLPSPAPSALLGRPHGEVGGPCLRLHSIWRPEPSGTASVPVCPLRSLCHVCPALAPLQGGVPGTGSLISVIVLSTTVNSADRVGLSGVPGPTWGAPLSGSELGVCGRAHGPSQVLGHRAPQLASSLSHCSASWGNVESS